MFAGQNRGSTGHVRGKTGQNRGQNGAFCEFSSVRHSLSGGKNAPKRPWRSPNAAATPKKTSQNPPVHQKYFLDFLDFLRRRPSAVTPATPDESLPF